jgi:hypothetical protein
MRATYGKPRSVSQSPFPDGSRVHPHQHLIVGDHRRVDVFELQDIRGPYLEWTIACIGSSSAVTGRREMGYLVDTAQPLEGARTRSAQGHQVHHRATESATVCGLRSRPW